MMQKIVTVILTILTFSLLLPGESQADNAEVLPKGVTRIRVNSKFYLNVDERYNDDGDSEPIGEDFNANLNSNVFPALSMVEAGFGLPAGSATVGKSVVDIEYQFFVADIFFEYGLSSRLTIGTKIPYWKADADVSAELDNSTATVGKNAAVPGGVAPLPFPGTVPFETEDVQNLLQQQFGYERVEDWKGSGIDDIEVGFRYQYFRSQDWRLAFTGAVRLPTGETDNPDNLVDNPPGDNAYALLFFLNNDYTGIKNLVLNATFRYDLVLPDRKTVRVPSNANQPITANKEKVDRDQGDYIKIITSAAYEFLQGSSFFLEYEFGYKFKDDVSGDKGLNYESLEDESDKREHIFKVGLAYSTIPLYAEKKFPLPLGVNVLYRNRFAGKNILKSKYIGFGVQVFF